jgi:hypothetical protein
MLRCATFCAACLLCFSHGAAAALVADHRFQNDLHSAVAGAPDLVALGAGTSFATEAVQCNPSRTVLTFPTGVGLKLAPMSSVLANTGTYTVLFLVRYDVASGARKYLDFKNGTADNGLYDINGALAFYNVATSPTAPITTAYVDIGLRRDAAAGQVTGFIDGAPVLQASDGIALGVVDANDAWRFFVDDMFGAEHSSGAVARIRVWDTALTDAEVQSADFAECVTVFNDSFEDPGH